MKTARRVLAVAILAAAGYVLYRFGTLNDAEVVVHLVAVELEPVRLWLALGGAFGTGLALGGLALLYPMARQALTARRYRKAVAALEAELHQLRSLPLAEGEGGASRSPPPAAGAARRPRGGR